MLQVATIPGKTHNVFYIVSALLAVQTAVIAREFACLSIHLSVRHIPVFCPEE